ncbi:uncharacterized protein LOC126425197 [Schistocerca serialis cubense]|uniref:uncharacterized protein LOC126425197 n=1 Tax=Schistocerca serialis cubense TaxID=2023355 RepID=UPI00214F42F1|nr:uncharacterized protein LOC126425197 [Schistocerca serialis cubense]
MKRGEYKHRKRNADSTMASFGTWAPPNFPEGESFVYARPHTPTEPPPPTVEYFASPKSASCQHKKHRTGSAKNIVVVESVDIPVNAVQPPGSALCLSALCAIAFTCALVFHGFMFYYALDTPMWFMMSWPFVLIPPIICSSIYLTVISRKVSALPNPTMVYLYLIFTITYMTWASYIISAVNKEGRCIEASHYSLVVSVLAMTVVACALEWWMTGCKSMQHAATDLNFTMAVYEKSPMKRKLIVTLRNNGKIVKQSAFNLEKFIKNYDMNYSGQCMPDNVLLYNNPVRCWNKKHKHCPMRYPGKCSAGGSEFNNTSCHYENEKFKQDRPKQYIVQYVADVPLRDDDDDDDQYENKKIRDYSIGECETDNSSFNNNIGKNNTTA